MASFTLPGPLCQVLRNREIDPGTLCRQQSTSPGPVGTGPSQFEIDSHKYKYLYLNYAYAVSYAMQGKSAWDSTLNAFLPKQLSNI